jgi:ribosome maturation factor RimP
VARQLGLSLWDVRFVKEGAGWFLRILIDKPGGVGIDDCEKMSRALNPLLDQADPIEQSYCLEVGSPGIGRELTRPEHFQRFAGARVRVKLIRPGQDGRRELTGTLLSCEDSVIRLRAGEEELIAIPKKDTSSVRLLDDELVEE